MNYAPHITNAVRAKLFRQGGFRAVLLTKVEAKGTLVYDHILIVAAEDTGKPVLCVAAERVRMPPHLRSGSHVLGLFPGDGHVNMGASDEWADLERFSEKALAVAETHLGLASGWEEQVDSAGTVAP